MINCHKCGRSMNWQNDFNLEDYGIFEQEGFVTVWDCAFCNITYEITEIWEENEREE